MDFEDQIQDDEPLYEYGRVERIKKYIRDHLTGDLRANIVANEFGISVSSLHHIFKKHTRQTFHECVEEIRIRKAFDLITKEGKIVKEVIHLTGYKKRLTFNRAFKRIYQHDPGYFMK